MPRPTNKNDLLKAADFYFSQLWKIIDSLSEEEQNNEFTFEDRDKNIRDVLIHLFEWHQLIIKWVPSNLKGDFITFLPKEYNWKTINVMNKGFWEKHQNTSYDFAIEQLKQSHQDVIKLIEQFTNDELFVKKHFSWTGTTSLGSYFISATSSHYDWALKKIKLHKKSCRANN